MHLYAHRGLVAKTDVRNALVETLSATYTPSLSLTSPLSETGAEDVGGPCSGGAGPGAPNCQGLDMSGKTQGPGSSL